MKILYFFFGAMSCCFRIDCMDVKSDAKTKFYIPSIKNEFGESACHRSLIRAIHIKHGDSYVDQLEVRSPKDFPDNTVDKSLFVECPVGPARELSLFEQIKLLHDVTPGNEFVQKTLLKIKKLREHEPCCDRCVFLNHELDSVFGVDFGRE